jgi:hypothetical protein
MTHGMAPVACFWEGIVNAPRAHAQLRHLVVAQSGIAVAEGAWCEEALCVVLLSAQGQAFPCMQQPILGTKCWPSVVLPHLLCHL